jgi:glycosyltransferase involved in cell wall biosynthesis
VLSHARVFAPLPDERVACFPWGLDLSVYQRDAAVRGSVRRALGWDDAVVAISTRAWHPSYRIPDVLDAVAAASVSVPALRLVLAGGGPDAATVEARLASDPRLAERVHCPGMVTEAELREWFMAADVYVSSAPSDGTSISLLEAMALELPVVVVDNPGNRSWVRAGQQGWLAKAAEPSSFASALVAAATDLAASDAMGKRARAEVELRANWPQNVKKLFGLLQRLLLQSPRPEG